MWPFKSKPKFHSMRPHGDIVYTADVAVTIDGVYKLVKMFVDTGVENCLLKINPSYWGDSDCIIEFVGDTNGREYETLFACIISDDWQGVMYLKHQIQLLGVKVNYHE